VTNRRRKDIQLHHVVGRSAKYNKIDIGHWWILPLSIELHDVASNHPCNVTHYKKCFEERYGTQKKLFQRMVYAIKADMYDGYTKMDLEALPPREVMESISNYRK
jgi:hypothetical protein